jgi:hypothetical protein
MKITPGVLQLAAILVAPIAALAGVWLSLYLATRADRQRWLRDHRASAYVTAIEAAESIRVSSLIATSVRKLERLHEEVSRPTQDQLGQPPSLDDIRKRMEQATLVPLTPLIHAESEISIFGDETAYRAIRRLVSAVIALLADRDETGDEKKARDTEVVEAENEVIDHCRKGLSLAPLQLT